MLNKCFSVGSFVALASVAAVWVGCSSDDTTTNTNNDAGTDSTLDSGSGNGNTTVDSGIGQSSGGLDGGVTVTYGTCTGSTKCGGDLVGDWKITGGCLDTSTFEAARASCKTLQESDVKIQAAGTLKFTATDLTRDTTVLLTGKVFIPTNDDTCGAAKGQGCGFLGIGLQAGVAGDALKFDKATCTDTATPAKGCNCDVEKTMSDDATQPYTTSAGTITTSAPAQSYDYCVSGSSNTYVETTQGNTLKLYVTIAKQ